MSEAGYRISNPDKAFAWRLIGEARRQTALNRAVIVRAHTPHRALTTGVITPGPGQRP
jgi:hypothetical protein